MIRSIRTDAPGCKVEILIPDFRRPGPLEMVLARPDVFNHNVETVPRLYPRAPRRGLPALLAVLRLAGRWPRRVLTKSGLMVGLGEDVDEMVDVLRTWRDGVQILTVGQYLQPDREACRWTATGSRRNLPLSQRPVAPPASPGSRRGRWCAARTGRGSFSSAERPRCPVARPGSAADALRPAAAEPLRAPPAPCPAASCAQPASAGTAGTCRGARRGRPGRARSGCERAL